jgi:hypothetical protein
LKRKWTIRGIRLRAWLFVGLAMTVASSMPAAMAIEVPELYAAEVALDPADPASRDEAYRAALNQVLVRITGKSDAAASSVFAELFPNPARYVLQYRPAEDNHLWVSLDGAAIESVLRRAGQTVWGGDRPLTLVWLAVDWGQGEREIVAADDTERSPGAQRTIDRNRQLRERLQDEAHRRGLPIAFPLLDTEDLQAINFSDIWGGFDDRLVDASERYGAAAVLIGRVRPAAAQPYRWTFHLGNESSQFMVGPAEVLDRVADTLFAEFAFSGDVAIETVQLTISGVNSLAAYGAVQRIMEDLNPVESYRIDAVSGDRLRYVVQVYGGTEKLARALELSGKLQRGSGLSGIDAGKLSGFDSLDFSYQP